jgi:hypothetical protein
MSTESHADACAAMGRTTEAHERFKPFVGTFHARVSMWMGPGEPHVSTGVMTNTLELGGRFLHQAYKADPADDSPFPNFEGRGYWGYNTVDNRYEGVWMDTACTWITTEQGQVDQAGRVWTMLSRMTNPETGEPVHRKSVIKLHDPDRHEMEMLSEAAPGQWQRMMHIEYTRA